MGRHGNACQVSQYPLRYYSWWTSGEARSRLSDCRGGGSGRDGGSSDRSNGGIAIDLSLCAVAGDMTGLAAAVAGLAGSVQWAAVRSSAVAGDMA